MSKWIIQSKTLLLPEQLLINKMVLDQVCKNRSNLSTMWFDYRKALDSISHHWLFEALRLAKLSEGIISNIRALAEKWTTKLILQTQESATVTDFIKCLTRVLQSDCLSLIFHFMPQFTLTSHQSIL